MGKVISKVLKVVAIGAALASVAVTGGASLGLTSAVFGAIAAGASIGASLLQKRPKSPQASPAGIDRMRASIQ